MNAHTIDACHGLRQIVRFNWPFYAAVAALVIPGVLGIPRLPGGATVHTLLYAALALAAFWTMSSLVVSWLVYDRSRLMSGDWIREALGYRPQEWVNIHTGFDETTLMLRARLGRSHGRVLDIFDAREMPEASRGRARRATTRVDAEPADFHHLPLPPETMDAAFLLFAAHELRTSEARCAFFREVHRTLAPGAHAIVAEHLRDAANVLAFGPGALHFHSRRAWVRTFTHTGFGIFEEFSITPFVRVFVLRRLP
jgi:SAM-dependent methyltransferase